ncbi:Lrp/AsnC family transcriptional regulator [Burkholderia gladioli]|jgi:DNA-binding Lrp family transcriptional regulator|uniref:Lrp/AsnC family transcriptional regulator n=1 Tax=Burkholderia gladioli TaxID=28095 RepID=UPI00136490D4|nr:Lrp/AsnC family transcriptional regulator [Burkholderia gladioli]KAF1064989.1 Leucine-responsive regulatory protein [Burkholderia gladioli]MDN7500874.1 Lrp/AsnC family transcriptional regulator [Burkholderia gladioli]MDN7605018.1 Lrp/AsnC family transcriptional regulator [Burkholderia gladioli]NRF88861.1 Lrp/AsnC family transcriptional regulator [Burkholderia gladioli]WAG21101.1 Lrp/AsnC family transcriptional regulator [Burkholderia gladioli]
MNEEKYDVRQNRDQITPLDAIDRKLLGVLVEDATMSYAELGKRVALSAPAVHERVKRLRRSGVIRRTSVQISPQAIGRSLLAFVHVDTKGWGKTPELMRLASCPEVEEIHSVAGDTSMLLKIRTEDARALEVLLSGLYEIPGVSATRTYVVLSTYLERSVQAG